MATVRSGLFTQKEFTYRRNVLKLAPDAFVVVNGALTSRIISPMDTDSVKDIEIRGGVTSINVSCAVSPPGASRANIEIVSPLYKGIHEDYFITLPNGARVSFFMPMMEIKIYMKGRYLEYKNKYVPRYYPVFWGMITNVQESYSSSNYTVNLSCEDFLSWWKYQKITINPSVQDTFFGGAVQMRFPSVFENMSAWEIIYALFTDSFFVQERKGQDTPAYYNFVYPKWSKNAFLPDSLKEIKETYGPLARDAINYWNNRFGLGVTNEDNPELVKEQLEKVPLEMYGLQGPIEYKKIRNKLLTFLDKKEGNYSRQTDTRADIDLDFSLLSIVQPYGLFDLFGNGAETTIFSKLEIATAICEKVFMEFYVDTNGAIVFKPPFYNLDVASGNVNYYEIGAEDIINFNTSFDSNSILNYLIVTGPLYQNLSSLEAIGYHADFDSIKRYGIRSEQVNVPYGTNAKQLKMIAVAEMARRNGEAYTGSVSIPLRPEMRLGYPVYIEHIDTFYYVTGINHSFAYGSAATTELSLQYRRERIFDDGNSGVLGSEKGDILYSCVLRDKFNMRETSVEEVEEKVKEIYEEYNQLNNPNLTEQDLIKDDIEAKINSLKKDIIAREQGVNDGPGLLGIWKIDRADITKVVKDQVTKLEAQSIYTSNELVMITDTTVPFTDKLGYRHIGGFPYGANLVLTKDGQMRDTSTIQGAIEQSADVQLNSSGVRDMANTGTSNLSNLNNNYGVTDTNTDTSTVDEQEEIIQEDFNENMDKIYASKDDLKQQQNEQAQKDYYDTEKKNTGLKALTSTDDAVKSQLNIKINDTETASEPTIVSN